MCDVHQQDLILLQSSFLVDIGFYLCYLHVCSYIAISIVELVDVSVNNNTNNRQQIIIINNLSIRYHV